MSASVIAIVIICLVAVIGLATWVVAVGRASHQPHEPNPRRGEMRGVVQGGMHVGGGRSVAPTRDAPVPEGGGEPPTIEEEVAARESAPGEVQGPGHGQGDRKRGNATSPMDL